MLLSEDQLGSTVTMSIGGINTSYRIYDLVQIFSGELTGWSLTEQKAVFDLSGIMARWNKKTLRIAQASCPWPFKGDECGYSGDGSCSQQFSNCEALGNYLNYGGFVYLPELQEKKIWWGQNPPS